MGYYRYDDNGDVLGAMDNSRPRRNNGNGDVAGAFDRRPQPVRVQGVVDPEDLCRAVRRCLINDLLVAGAQDENNNNNNHCRRPRRCCH